MNNKIMINQTAMTVKEYCGQRVVTLKDIDMVHQRPEGTARRNFNANKEHFIEGVDYFVRNSSEAQKEFGIAAPNGLTLVTEPGYLMVVKSFTDDLAWQVQRELVNSYFRVKEEQKKTPPKPLTLASVNNTAKILGKAMDEAGMEPVQKVLAFQQLYRKAGIDLNLTFPADERLYFLEDMAKELGVVSNNGIPHKQAMGAIVRKLSLDAGEKHLVHFERNGHMDSTDKYSRSVLDKAKAWLEENQYPAVIPGETKNFNVRYAHKG